MTKDDLFFASILKDAKFITDLEIPLIKREEKCDLNNIVSFNSKIKDLHNLENLFFHFYDVNLKFEDYLKLFKYKKFAKIKFCKGIIMPNLNIKDNENIIEYIYKIYQNRQLIYFFQKHGLIVIPTIDWYDFLSINYSLISLFKYGIYAIDIRNKINNDLNIKCFKKCMRKIILKLKPLSIWFYDDNKQIKVDIFANKNKLNFLDISNLVLGFFNKKIINIIKNNSYFKCKELPNMNLINFMVKSKNWNIDTIKANNTIIPIDIVPFEKHHKIINKKKVVLHFYMFDNSFKQVINNPNKYVSILKQFGGIISFDLSLYIDMPLSLQMVNKFKNHKVAAYLQKLGINVIPNVRWGDERSFSFCFEGFEKRGIYAVSTHGCIKTKIEKTMFVNGLRKMIEVLEPKVILVHGPMPKEVFDQFKRKVVFVNYSSWISRCKNNNNNKENKYENKYEKIQANN